MALYKSLPELVGGTPLFQADRYAGRFDLPVRLLLKLESCNPGGSAKDRVALQMIRAAREAGQLHPDSTIIEPTSGNTGIGLAAVGAALGYRVILTMPDTMSAERRSLLAAYGAELVLTPGAQGMQGAVDKANELAAALPHSFVPGQFDNPQNAAAHYAATGPEIWADADGRVDYFIAGVGTGGTITGAGRYLKEKNPALKVIAVEPFHSPLLSQGKTGKHNLQGIGANFVPAVLDRSVYDEVLPVREEEAYAAARALLCEGLLAGISGGAALHAARVIAARPEARGKSVVVLLPDGGERYLSTALYQPGE